MKETRLTNDTDETNLDFSLSENLEEDILLQTKYFSLKNAFILNEETLVTFSFVLFVLFTIKFYGQTIKESLNFRGKEIKVDLEETCYSQEKALKTLHDEHFRAISLEPVIKLTKKIIINLFQIQSNEGLIKIFSILIQKIKEKSNALYLKYIEIVNKIPRLIGNDIDINVLYYVEKIKKPIQKKGEQLNEEYKVEEKLIKQVELS